MVIQATIFVASRNCWASLAVSALPFVRNSRPASEPAETRGRVGLQRARLDSLIEHPANDAERIADRVPRKSEAIRSLIIALMSSRFTSLSRRLPNRVRRYCRSTPSYPSAVEVMHSMRA